ncbi:transposase [Salmonella enterica subsp. enterica]|nr:transposase [Salmonella enterica]ECY0387029.1 transposase [Salmonella enterica]EDS4148094.1 transposase [Salmonella enterica subsp. enterica]
MKKRFSDEQIISILREAEAGVSVGELCRKHAISDATFYRRFRYIRHSGHTYSGQYCAVSRLSGYDKN